jgi:hypothetical protein
MLQPRYSRLSSLATTAIARSKLATGKGFGGSLLQRVPEQELVFPVISSSVSIAACQPSISVRQSSPLIVEVGKIVLLAGWLWLSIGANFCGDRISSIVSTYSQDI